MDIVACTAYGRKTWHSQYFSSFKLRKSGFCRRAVVVPGGGGFRPADDCGGFEAVKSIVYNLIQFVYILHGTNPEQQQGKGCMCMCRRKCHCRVSIMSIMSAWDQNGRPLWVARNRKGNRHRQRARMKGKRQVVECGAGFKCLRHSPTGQCGCQKVAVFCSRAARTLAFVCGRVGGGAG